MHARPRFITTLLALSATALVGGCFEDQGTEDPLAAIAAQYQKALRDRPVVREQAAADDDTAESLRQLAGRAQAAGREGDERAAAILTSGIRSTAATFDYDEAMRAESRAATLRALVRSMAADADLLATTAERAESLDLGDTNLLLEGQLSAARDRLDAAESELDDLRSQTEIYESQRDESLAEAMDLDEEARSQDEMAPNATSITDWQDHKNTAAYWRSQSHQRRIDAARQEISILTIAPTLVLADARRNGASETIDAAREARRAAENSLSEVRGYADEVRDLLDDLAAGATETIARIEAIETGEVLPRLEASIADFEAAAGASRPMTRGGSREDAAAGWRAIANAQFGAGRGHWEIATIQGRRGDLFARLAAGGVLADSSAAGRLAEAAYDARDTSLEAAEASFNEAIASLSNIQGDEAATRIRSTIESAIAGLKGQSMARTVAAAPTGGGTMSGGGMSSSGGSGGGFGTPAALASFLSDSSNALSPAAFKRMKAAMRATTPSGQAVESLLSAAGMTMPLIEALSAKFGEDAVVAAFADGGGVEGGRMSLSMNTQFSVDSVDGDTATMKSSDGSQTLVLAKTPSGWVVDLDASIEGDPNMKMMVQMMGPMLEQMMAPMRGVIDDLTPRVEAGEFATLDEAMAAFAEASAAAQPQGGAGGFPGGF